MPRQYRLPTRVAIAGYSGALLPFVSPSRLRRPLRLAVSALGAIVLGGCCNPLPPRPEPGALWVGTPRLRSAETLRIARQPAGPLKRSSSEPGCLEVPGRDRPVPLYLSAGEASRLEAESPTQPLEIRYWYHEETWSPDTILGHGELVSVRSGDTVLIDRTYCRRHERTMIRRTVPIEFGLPSMEFMEAARRDFPHAAFQLGGCVVDPGSPKEAPAYVCMSCDAACQAWNESPAANQ